MSINHFSPDLPETQYWWSQYTVQELQSPANTPPPPSSNNHKPLLTSTAGLWSNSNHSRRKPPLTINLNNEEIEEHATNNRTTMLTEHEKEITEEIFKQPLFEKPLTPSDVGKLNRLVIPKQHAEKYFPLNGAVENSNEKGLLLSFEDELGKSWRFRYSYWNSSQSYVLTKGWSRFVKEKRLDAGDVVLFLRHRMDVGRLFIGWRKRNGVVQETKNNDVVSQASGGWNNRGFYSTAYNNPNQQYHHVSSSSTYQPEICLNAGLSLQNQTTTSSTTVSGNSKRLRLFGVNLDCQLADDQSEPSTPDQGSPMSSQGQVHQNQYHQFYSNHMDMVINFSGGGGEVYRQG